MTRRRSTNNNKGFPVMVLFLRSLRRMTLPIFFFWFTKRFIRNKMDQFAPLSSFLFFLNFFNFNPFQLCYNLFIGINIITFILFGCDKVLAKSNSNSKYYGYYYFHRIPERTLLVCYLLGGSCGGSIAMELFQHKITKSTFQTNLLFISIVHMFILVALNMT